MIRMTKAGRGTLAALCLILTMILPGCQKGGDPLPVTETAVEPETTASAQAEESIPEETEEENAVTIPEETAPQTEAENEPLRLYVSTDGDDGAEGSEADPLATLYGAKEKLKKLKAGSAEVIFAGGTYFLDKPVTFSASDAPNVVYRSAEGEEAVFTGAECLTGTWDGTEEVNGRTAWVRTLADLPEGAEINTVFGEEGFLVNARIPSEGFLYAEGGGRAQNPTDPTYNQNLSLFVKPDDLPEVEGLAEDDLRRARIKICHYWAEEYLPLQSYHAAAREIVFRYATNNTTAKNDAYCIENVKSGLDAPGEWYFDYGASKLYYLPKDGETQESTPLWLGRTVTLMEFSGARNLEFRDVTFARTNWEYQKLPSQAAYSADSCLAVRNSKGINFISCRFSAVGATCVNYGCYETHTADSAVTGCSFENIGMHAVVISGKNAKANCADNITVSDCLISGFGKVRLYSVAILQTHAANCTISHNEIANGSYTAISAGWTWGYSGTVCENNRITDNLIYHIGHAPLSDMGGIYVLGTQTNSEISGNVIFDVKAGDDATTYGGWGVYTDEGSTGFTIRNNVVYDCGSQGQHQHYGQDNDITNNIFAFNEEGQVRSSRKEDHNQFHLHGNILAGQNQLMYQNVEAGRFTDSGNLYYDYAAGAGTVYSGSNKTADSSGNFDAAAMKKLGYYRDGVFEDPCFTDPENRNFTFRDTSAAEKIGFTPIDCSGAGSPTFGSGLLLNDLRAPLANYPETLTNAYDAAKEAFLADRTEENIAALRTAHDALHAFDEFAVCVMPEDRIAGGKLYDDYLAALEKVRQADGDALAEAGAELKKAYEAGTAAGCSVTFDYGDRQETAVIPCGETVIAGGEAVVPPEGFLFGGWKRADGGDAPDPLTAGFGEVTLRAEWIPAYTLSFNGTDEADRKVGAGLPLGELPAVKMGVLDTVLFCGWSLSEDGREPVTAETLMPDEDTTLYPILKEACVLRFSDGGFKRMLIADGESAGELPVYTARGKRFVEWNTEKDGSGQTYTADTAVKAGEVMLYAVTVPCRQILFDNEFDLSAAGLTSPGNDAGTPVTDPINGTVAFEKTGDNCFLNVPQRRMQLTAGHTYRVYYIFTENGEETGNTRLTVMPYDKAGNWGSDYYVEAITPGGTFTVTAPYTAVGLRPGASGGAETGAMIEYCGVAVQDITGEENKSMPKDANGDPEFFRSVDVGQPAGTLPTMEMPGRTFAGWNTAEDGSGETWTAETFMPDKTVTLYPMWN